SCRAVKPYPGHALSWRVTLVERQAERLVMLFEFDNTANENIYKLLVSTVVPRPIAWVTTQDIDGSVNAAPFSFFNAVSGNPPVVAIGIGGGGPGGGEGTRGNTPRAGEFVVNLVSNRL